MTVTLALFVDDEDRRRVATLRARAYVGPAPGLVARDGDDRIVVSLPDGTEANARALAGNVLFPDERATAIVSTAADGDGDEELGYVYQGRDGGGVQRLAAELGDGGDAGSDARAAINRQFGLDAVGDDIGLAAILVREFGDDYRDRDELHFYAQQLAYVADPDTDLRKDAIRCDPEARVRDLVDAFDDDGLATALDDEDWEWLASLAADHTTRPPVAYEPDDHEVV